MYLANLTVIWKYFRVFDHIYLAIFLNLCLLFPLMMLVIGESLVGKYVAWWVFLSGIIVR